MRSLRDHPDGRVTITETGPHGSTRWTTAGPLHSEHLAADLDGSAAGAAELRRFGIRTMHARKFGRVIVSVLRSKYPQHISVVRTSDALLASLGHTVLMLKRS